jgi:hypothetical protein
LYQEVSEKTKKQFGKGDNKPIIANEFCKKLSAKQEEKLRTMNDLIKRIVGLGNVPAVSN